MIIYLYDKVTCPESVQAKSLQRERKLFRVGSNPKPNFKLPELLGRF